MESIAGSRPNIIFILTDDQGYGDVAAHGNSILKTPIMDQLYRDSVRFTDFVVSSTCTPTRCALMTGMHEFKSGITHTLPPRCQMNLSSVTVAALLQSAGYRTGMFGKWHLGSNGSYRPEQRGFDVAMTTIDDTQISHYNPVFMKNNVEQASEGFREDLLFDEAMTFIEANKEEPFFCYIPTYSPHEPLKAPAIYVDRYRDTVPEKQANFYGMITNIDDNIGRLLTKLQELDIEHNTLLIFMNDNGGTFGVDIWNAQMRGCKATSWYGGTRAISFWRWPGVLQPREIDSLAAHVDLLPTLAMLAGCPIPDEIHNQLDGLSLVQTLMDGQTADPDRCLFEHVGRWSNGKAEEHKYSFCGVRWQHYHLVQSRYCHDPACNGECKHYRRAEIEKTGYYSQSKAAFNYALTEARAWQLYDVHQDPAQENNISDQHPELCARLISAYDAWWDSIQPCLIHE
jgi:arylsulfatase A-like enzyme